MVVVKWVRVGDLCHCYIEGWILSYVQTCGHIRARLLFAIIRAASLYLRGSRVKWRSGLGFEDGLSVLSHALK